MSVSVIINNKSVDVRLTNFSDGAEYLKIETEPQRIDSAVVVIEGESSGRIPWLAIQCAEILKELNMNMGGDLRLMLNVPYLPFGRADRKFEEGMTIPLKVFMQTISQYYSKLYTRDPHNFQAVGLYAASYDMEFLFSSQKHVLRENMEYNSWLNLKKDLVLVAPDKGAQPKALEIFDDPNIDRFSTMVTCEKVRNPVNGWIESIDITDIKAKNGNHTLEGRDFFIVDDICDGGLTFTMTASMLKELGARSVTLYVTHGIFSKGLEPFDGIIDEIFVDNLVGGYVSFSELHEFNKRTTRGATQ